MQVELFKHILALFSAAVHSRKVSICGTTCNFYFSSLENAGMNSEMDA